MKKQFLKELNRELRFLSKEERKTCLNNYEEIMLDKIENGITEENAVYSLGNVKQIAKEILTTYQELDKRKSIKNKKSIDRNNMAIDAVLLVASYLLAFYLTFYSGLFKTAPYTVPFSYYMVPLVFILPCYLFLFYMYKLYEIKYLKKQKRDVLNIICANTVGVILFIVALVLLQQGLFSRIMVLLFYAITTILQIIFQQIMMYFINSIR